MSTTAQDWRPARSLLVQGGTSGIGVTAIQMAAAIGNRVFATAGSDEKCAACVRLGATEAFNYKTQDFEKEISRVTGGKGVNVILDMVGGDYVPRELKCLADDGRLVFIAYLRGPKTEMNIDAVMRRRLTITGSTLRPRPVEFKGAIARSLREKIWPLIESGQHQARDLQDLPARAGGGSAPPDGKLAAHRQDRPHRLAASVFSHSRNAATSGRAAAFFETIAK